MWETTSSLTRAAVLALVTCSFAAVWSNDQQTQADFALARKANWQRSNSPTLAGHSASGSDDFAVAEAVQRVGSRYVVGDRATWTAPRYRIVAPTGEVVGTIVASATFDESLQFDFVDDQGKRHCLEIDIDPLKHSEGERRAANVRSASKYR